MRNLCRLSNEPSLVACLLVGQQDHKAPIDYHVAPTAQECLCDVVSLPRIPWIVVPHWMTFPTGGDVMLHPANAGNIDNAPVVTHWHYLWVSMVAALGTRMGTSSSSSYQFRDVYSLGPKENYSGLAIRTQEINIISKGTTSNSPLLAWTVLCTNWYKERGI